MNVPVAVQTEITKFCQIYLVRHVQILVCSVKVMHLPASNVKMLLVLYITITIINVWWHARLDFGDIKLIIHAKCARLNVQAVSIITWIVVIHVLCITELIISCNTERQYALHNALMANTKTSPNTNVGYAI